MTELLSLKEKMKTWKGGSGVGPLWAGVALGRTGILGGDRGDLPAVCPCSCPFASLWAHTSELRWPLHDPWLEGAQIQRGSTHPWLLHRQARGSP